MESIEFARFHLRRHESFGISTMYTHDRIYGEQKQGWYQDLQVDVGCRFKLIWARGKAISQPQSSYVSRPRTAWETALGCAFEFMRAQTLMRLTEN